MHTERLLGETPDSPGVKSVTPTRRPKINFDGRRLSPEATTDPMKMKTPAIMQHAGLRDSPTSVGGQQILKAKLSPELTTPHFRRSADSGR